MVFDKIKTKEKQNKEKLMFSYFGSWNRFSLDRGKIGTQSFRTNEEAQRHHSSGATPIDPRGSGPSLGFNQAPQAKGEDSCKSGVSSYSLGWKEITNGLRERFDIIKLKPAFVPTLITKYKEKNIHS